MYAACGHGWHRELPAPPVRPAVVVAASRPACRTPALMLSDDTSRGWEVTGLSTNSTVQRDNCLYLKIRSISIISECLFVMLITKLHRGSIFNCEILSSCATSAGRKYMYLNTANKFRSIMLQVLFNINFLPSNLRSH